MALALVATAVTLAGCRTCPTFDEMVVTDPTGVATDAELGIVEATIAEFAATTGRSGVCVPEVRVVPEAADPELFDLGGYYSGPHVPIVVKAGEDDLARVTRHELCHALDTEEVLHDGHDDLFPADTLPESQGSHDKDVGEVFAQMCDHGAGGLAVAKPLYDDCNFATEAAGAAYVLDHVYVGTPVAAPVDLDVARHPLEPDVPGASRRLARAVLGDETLVLLGLEPLLVGLYRYDSTSSSGIGHTALAGPMYADWTLLTGDGEVLIASDSDPRYAWRVTAAGGATALPAFPRVGPGVLADGVAWVSDDDGLSAYDLDAGTFVDVPLPFDHAVDVTGWAASDGALVGTTARDGLLLRAGDAWVVHPGPGGLLLRGAALSGDRWVVTSTVVETYDYYGSRIDTLLLFDREAEAWAVPVDPCGLDGSYNPVVLANGDDAWVIDDGADVFGDLGDEYLARISVE